MGEGNGIRISERKNKGTTVRLTEQAHKLLTESVEDSKTSMKAAASEAIFLYVQSEVRDKEIDAYINQLNKTSIKLQKRIPLYLAASAAIGTVGGIVIGLVL